MHLLWTARTILWTLLTIFCSCLGLSRQFGYLDRYQSHDQFQRRDHILTHRFRIHLIHRQKIEKGGSVIQNAPSNRLILMCAAQSMWKDGPRQ